MTSLLHIRKMRWLDMRRILFVIAIALVWCALPAWVWAQETGADTQQQAQAPPIKARPKLGVALEGGGALGLAHIGVLQWFEDHHIPIDYVAGTSMVAWWEASMPAAKRSEERRVGK